MGIDHGNDMACGAERPGLDSVLFARFSMILSGIQLVIWARTDIVCFVGVMAFSYGCMVAAIKMSMTPIFSTAPSSYGTAVDEF